MSSKKGKNKPRPNKPTNPSQKEDQLDIQITENVLEEKTESAQKSEERVPEIISEIVTPPVVESKDKEGDSPKKPKRNRGKKKKDDKDDGESQEEQPSKNVGETKVETIEIQMQEVISDENVTPSARKKKNKNKKSVDMEEKPTDKIEKEVSLGDNKPEGGDIIIKEEPTPQDAGDTDTKTSKKKNKKKKRSDSERSDNKTEDISCISAFQMLLQDEKSVVKSSDSELMTAVKMPKCKDSPITNPIQKPQKEKEFKDMSQEVLASVEAGGKNKKKNKKDKKDHPKDTEIETNISLVTAIKPVSKDSRSFPMDMPVGQDDKQAEIVSTGNVPTAEKDSKPKAKIAKPVERKQKGKGDKQHDETPFETEQDSEIDKPIAEPLEDKISALEVQNQSEIIKDEQTESALKVEQSFDNKQDVSKHHEKKKKGKPDKHGEEILETRDSKNKQTIEKEQVLPQEPILVMDVSGPIDIQATDETNKQEEEIKQTPITPEKKRKGKANKHSQEMTEISAGKNIETKDIASPEALVESPNPVITLEIKTDVKKEGEPILLQEIETKKEEANKEETIKSSERKRKGKKDPKIHEVQPEATAQDIETKMKEPSTFQLAGEEKLQTAPGKLENIDVPTPVVLKENENIDKTRDLSKPVEIKRKSKKDRQAQPHVDSTTLTQETETQVQVCTEPVAVQLGSIISQGETLKDVQFMPEPLENIQSMQEALSDIDTITTKPASEEVKETSFINPPDKEMGKKRKKSPKPSKQEQKHKTLESKADPITIVPESLKSDKTFSIKSQQKSDETITPAKPQPDSMLPILITERTVPLDIIDSTPTAGLVPEMEDVLPAFETKTKKKRKKSPKPPREPETVSSISESSMAKDFETTEANKTTDKPKEIVQDSDEKIESFQDLPSDIEISSLKADESEGSTCGFTPDIIQYPRATSQDLIDDNNNSMVIQEIGIAEEVKLQVPFDIPDTPLIQGSGATPLETPDNILVGIKISQADVSKVKAEPEKTDIKSKMMEVNQDMEELRLSIERSLAELTSIEKSDGEIEKQFEEKRKAEVKISMPSEIVAKTQSEKTESQQVKQSESILSTPPTEKPIESSNIPAKTSMFFDKELKVSGVELKPSSIQQEIIPIADIPKTVELLGDVVPPIPPMRKDKSSSKERENKDTKPKPTDENKQSQASPMREIPKPVEMISDTVPPPVCPARKDNKKGKNKKKGRPEAAQSTSQTESTPTTMEAKDALKDHKKEEKTEHKSDTKQLKGKQQCDTPDTSNSQTDQGQESSNIVSDFEPIENFEDAMTSSADDINKTFEIIASESNRSIQASHVNPEIKIVAPVEDAKRDKRDEKINPVSQPKNLLGHPDIPVRLNKTDYKKEKNKTPNAISAKVKIKDSVEIEAKKESKDTQTDNIRKFMKGKSIDESFTSVTNENDEFVYKYSFRKVFLQSACHICKKELKQSRVPCNYCNLLFYCSSKHKDEDWPQHQGLCFAISTIVHLKDQKHIYGDAQNVTGQDYRLLRMQMIVSCERVLKRKLAPWEQEALLYPRMCADAGCREWRQSKLQDCDGCGQISFCINNPHHFPKSHQRWCKSYALYQKLVCHQQTKGRLEPKLPTKVMEDQYQIPEKINEALATMYEEKIDMNDIEYAALTQIATSPLTAAYCHQTFAATAQANGTYKKSSCTVHIIGGELQFEADALNKWEVFFLHLRPQLHELRVVMIGADLNPSNLPLELLSKVKLCDSCRLNKRRVVFGFQDKTTYHEYRASDEFIIPDIVCAFNPSFKRCSMYNGKDHWPKTINCVLKQKVPFLVTSHTINELQRDLTRVKEVSDTGLKTIIEPRLSNFASVRPDRNFISDDEIPLLFNNYCFMLVCGQN